MLKQLMNLLLVIVIVMVLFCAFLMWREPSMIYYPDRNIIATPAAAKMAFEDLTLKTADGVHIHGWWIPAATGVPVPPDTVLLLHGNAGNIADRLEKIAILREMGLDVCIIDYRGFGRSEGMPNEQGTYLDAQAAYDYLMRNRKIPPAQLIVYGESLGTAIATELATRVPVGGVVLEEAFTSMGDVAQKLFPILPVRYLVRNKYDTLHKIGRINAPLLIFHSRDDEFFPFQSGERLFAAAHEPKQLIELRGRHNDAFITSIAEYKRGLKQFLDLLHRSR